MDLSGYSWLKSHPHVAECATGIDQEKHWGGGHIERPYASLVWVIKKSSRSVGGSCIACLGDDYVLRVQLGAPPADCR